MKWIDAAGKEYETDDNPGNLKWAKRCNLKRLTEDGKPMGRPVGTKNKRLDDNLPTKPEPVGNEQVTATADVQDEFVSALELDIKAAE